MLIPLEISENHLALNDQPKALDGQVLVLLIGHHRLQTHDAPTCPRTAL